MLGVHDLPLFIMSGLVLNVTPGPDLLYVTARGAGQGKRAAVAASLGIGAGCLVHILAAALGLSAVLARSALAFSVVKYAGAAYMAYVGGGMLLSALRKKAGKARADSDIQPQRQLSLGAVFRQGFLTDALNPKVALFFLAFLPQFVDPAVSRPVPAFLLLGTIFVVNGFLVTLSIALASAVVSSRLSGRTAVGRWLSGTAGALFIGLSVRLAMAERA